jgi:hypothetical protein
MQGASNQIPQKENDFLALLGEGKSADKRLSPIVKLEPMEDRKVKDQLPE